MSIFVTRARRKSERVIVLHTCHKNTIRFAGRERGLSPLSTNDQVQVRRIQAGPTQESENWCRRELLSRDCLMNKLKRELKEVASQDAQRVSSCVDNKVLRMMDERWC